MKKIWFALAFLLMVLYVSPISAEGGPFSDVPTDSPYAPAVQYLKDKGATQGYSDGTFKPEDVVTRAAFVKMGVISAGVQLLPEGYGISFSDVPAGNWFEPYARTMRYKNIVRGYQNQFFPDSPVSVVEGLKMLMGMYGISADNYQHPTQALVPGNDNFKLDQWYTGYLNYALAKGIVMVEGLKDLNPDSQLTRGDAAALMLFFNRNKVQEVQAVLDKLEEEIVKVMQSLQVNDIKTTRQHVAVAEGLYHQAILDMPEDKVVKGVGKIVQAFRVVIEGIDDPSSFADKKVEAADHLKKVEGIEPTLKDLANNIAAFIDRLQIGS